MDEKSESPLPMVEPWSQNRESGSFKKICILNLTIGCPLGDRCKDIHTIRSTFCKYYGSALGCKYGSLCRFSHASPDSVLDCEQWYFEGWCSYGEKCIYAHDSTISWNRSAFEWESHASYERRLRSMIKQDILNEEGKFVWENCLNSGLNAPVSVTISRLTGNSVTCKFRSRRQVRGGDPDRMDLYRFQVSKITFDFQSNRWIKTPFGAIESPLHPCHEITVSNLHPRRYYCLSYSILFSQSSKSGDRESFCTAPIVFQTKKLDINLNDCSLKLKLLKTPLRWACEWPPTQNWKSEIVQISNIVSPPNKLHLQFETKNIAREDRYFTDIVMPKESEYVYLTHSFVLSADKRTMYLQTCTRLFGESVEQVCLYKLREKKRDSYILQNEQELLLTDVFNHRFEQVGEKQEILKDLIGEDCNMYFHNLSICHCDDSLILSFMCYHWGSDGNIEMIQVFADDDIDNDNISGQALRYLWEMRNESRSHSIMRSQQSAKDHHMDMWRDDIWKEYKKYGHVWSNNQSVLTQLQCNLGHIYWYNPNTLFHFWNGNMYVLYSNFESQLYYTCSSIAISLNNLKNEYISNLICKYAFYGIDLFRNLKICQLDWKHGMNCVTHFDPIENLLFVGDKHQINQIYRVLNNVHVTHRVEGLGAAVKVRNHDL